MATDIMIKFEGGKIPIVGESTLKNFEGQLEAMSFTEGFSNPRDATGTGQVASRTNVSDVSISSVASKHSNLLKKSMYENNAFSKVTVSFLMQVGAETVAYDIRTYENVYITSYSMGKSNESPGHEQWTFSATGIQVSYLAQDPVTHALTEASSVEINLAASATV